MKRLTHWILAGAISCAPLSAAYAYKATVAFSGATGATQTNITLAFRFNDLRIATTANGGQIQNLCSRNGNSVPCDFVFTNDSTCASVTGSYTWGFEGNYSATTGAGHGWVMIPSYTTSGVTPTVCIGNSAVTTYQGGAAGAEFDSNTSHVWHLANGATLAGTDFKGSANCTPTNSPTATTGQVDGAMGVTGTQYCASSVASPARPYTLSMWIKPSGTGGYRAFWGNSGSAGSGGLEMRLNDSTNTITVLRSQASGVFDSTGHPAANAWSRVVVSVDGSGNLSFYLNNASAETGTQSSNFSSSAVWLGAMSFSENFAGTIDDAVIATTNRSANWVATEYANQNAPPVVGAFTALGGSSSAVPAAIY